MAKSYGLGVKADLSNLSDAYLRRALNNPGLYRSIDVLGELERRNRLRKEQNTPSTTTVAQDVRDEFASRNKSAPSQFAEGGIRSLSPTQLSRGGIVRMANGGDPSENMARYGSFWDVAPVPTAEEAALELSGVDKPPPGTRPLRRVDSENQRLDQLTRNNYLQYIMRRQGASGSGMPYEENLAGQASGLPLPPPPPPSWLLPFSNNRTTSNLAGPASGVQPGSETLPVADGDRRSSAGSRAGSGAPDGGQFSSLGSSVNETLNDFRNYQKKMIDDNEQQRISKMAEQKENRRENQLMALAKMGFATAGRTGESGLTAIGKGGEAGMDYFAKAEEARRKNNLGFDVNETTRIKNAVDSYYSQGRLGVENRKTDVTAETARYGADSRARAIYDSNTFRGNQAIVVAGQKRVEEIRRRLADLQKLLPTTFGPDKEKLIATIRQTEGIYAEARAGLEQSMFNSSGGSQWAITPNNAENYN